ncbi:MAG: hypothetical protein ACI4DN_09240 [Lachnospiraceae bacterium]
MMKFKGFLVTALFTLSFLAGCGEKKELTAFKEDMASFYTEIAAIGDSIEAITPDSEDAVTALLDNLEALDEQFRFLADIQVPAEFSNVEELADDAAQHMTNSVDYYRQAYENEIFDENLAQAASQHYESAMKRIKYIASLLKGEIPEGDDIIITEGDDTEFAPYSEESELPAQ